MRGCRSRAQPERGRRYKDFAFLASEGEVADLVFLLDSALKQYDNTTTTRENGSMSASP